MEFELIGEVRDIQPIAIGGSVRELARLRRRYGRGAVEKIEGDRKGAAHGWHNSNC